MLGAGRVGTTLAWLVAAVAAVIESIGYDVVAMASLRAGRALQPGGPVFGASLRDEFALAVRKNAAA